MNILNIEFSNVYYYQFELDVLKYLYSSFFKSLFFEPAHHQLFNFTHINKNRCEKVAMHSAKNDEVFSGKPSNNQDTPYIFLKKIATLKNTKFGTILSPQNIGICSFTNS